MLFRKALSVAFVALMVGCAQNSAAPVPSSSAAESVAPKRFASSTDVSVALQVAGTRADYANFAQIVAGDQSASVISTLQKNFGGTAFTSKTVSARASARSDQRVLVLSSGGKELTLELEMAKGSDGWKVTSHSFAAPN